MFMIPIPKHPALFPLVLFIVLAGALWAAIKITCTAFFCVIPVTYYTLKEVYNNDAE